MTSPPQPLQGQSPACVHCQVWWVLTEDAPLDDGGVLPHHGAVTAWWPKRSHHTWIWVTPPGTVLLPKEVRRIFQIPAAPMGRWQSTCPTVCPPYWSAWHGLSMMASCHWVWHHAWRVLSLGGRSSNIWQIKCIWQAAYPLFHPHMCHCSRRTRRQNSWRGTDSCTPWSLSHQAHQMCREVAWVHTTANSQWRDMPGSFGNHNLPACASSPLMGGGLLECGEIALPPERMGGQRGDLQPMWDALKWMKEHQHSYTDDQLDFWHLLCPLTNGSEKASWCLACQLLSIWHWSLALDPPTCPLACLQHWTSVIG